MAKNKIKKPAQKVSKSTSKKPHKAAEPKGKAKKKLVGKPVEKAAASLHKNKAMPNPMPEKKAKENLKDNKKIKLQKKPKGKKEEGELEDDYFDGGDFEGGDEINEYVEDLKAVEEADLEDSAEEAWTSAVKDDEPEEIYLTDAEGNRYCRAHDCDQIANVDAYCRYHYLLFWKKIQVRKKILSDGKLGRYIDELTARYPDKFLEMIRRDLRTEKDFVAAIQELEIDEAGMESEFEDDSQSFIDEVRGIGEGTASSTVDDEEF